LYRQYTFSGAYLEPRVHVLLSRNARGNEGFVYHSVQMKSIPLECVKEIEILEREWSEGLGLKDGFSIGVDLICCKLMPHPCMPFHPCLPFFLLYRQEWDGLNFLAR
jgi:hypothetical protein